MRQQYQEALSVEVEVFQERIQTSKHQGLRGSELVSVAKQRGGGMKRLKIRLG